MILDRFNFDTWIGLKLILAGLIFKPIRAFFLKITSLKFKHLLYLP